MIHIVECKPCDGMKTVSLQGTQLSASERRRLELQRRYKATPNPNLMQMVDDACAAADKLREEGTQGENPNKFRFESESRSAPFLGDVFGY